MALLDIQTEQELSLSSVGKNGDLGEYAQIECPAPGIYHDMDAEHYHKIRAASSSQLKKLRRSPAHMHSDMLEPFKQTDAMKESAAIHTRILEPERYAKEYAIMKKVDGRTKEGKAYKAAFEIDNLGKTIIDEECAALCEAAREAIMAHPICRSFVEAEGPCEASIFAQIDGVNCRVRPDKYLYRNETLCVLDIKAMENASPSWFSKECEKYGYHIQGGFYVDVAMKVLPATAADFILIAIEKEYVGRIGKDAIVPYVADSAFMEIGQKEYRQLLKIYDECEKNQIWPGYGDDLVSLALPPWKISMTQYE